MRPGDLLHLDRCIELAERGARTAAPNPLVGCVIVRDGEVIGEGWHERPGMPHAERVALAAAGDAAGDRAAVLDIVESPYIAASYRTYADIVHATATQPARCSQRSNRSSAPRSSIAPGLARFALNGRVGLLPPEYVRLETATPRRGAGSETSSLKSHVLDEGHRLGAAAHAVQAGQDRLAQLPEPVHLFGPLGRDRVQGQPLLLGALLGQPEIAHRGTR